MTIPKKYLHDRFILLLLSINVSLCIISIVWILLHLGNHTSGLYTVQYRADVGLNGFKSGGVADFIGFMAFAVFTTAFSIFLSIRIFRIRRGFSVGLLAMATLLLVLVIIVSNALLLI